MPKNITHRGPQQTRVLDRDVLLLRQLDPRVIGRGLMDELARTNLGAGQIEGDQIWFLDNYVAAEQPRNAELAKAIMQATTGFAIARTDSGQILAEFPASEGRKAAHVADSARVELAVNVAMEELDEVSPRPRKPRTTS